MLHALSNSTVHINDKPTKRLHYDYEIEPHYDLLISMPRCMYNENKTLRICWVNANDGYVIIKKSKKNWRSRESWSSGVSGWENPIISVVQDSRLLEVN